MRAGRSRCRRSIRGEASSTLLLSNEGKAARERLTLIRVYEELRGLGYEGSYDAVRRYAKSWLAERGAVTAQAYVPLSFAPGEAYQFDWSHEIVMINGVTVTVKVAHVRLCQSRMLFVRAYPRETQEMVFDAHNRAFAFFKGTCTRGIYDNMKTAVETVFIGKDRQYNRRFLRMCGHYLVEPTACTPAAGWEKGQVENQVGLVRERFFTPRRRVASYDELNAWLLDRCVAYAKAHKHPELADLTIWQAFEAERAQLVPIRGPFDGFHATQASVSKTCLAACRICFCGVIGSVWFQAGRRLCSVRQLWVRATRGPFGDGLLGAAEVEAGKAHFRRAAGCAACGNCRRGRRGATRRRPFGCRGGGSG